MKRTHEPLTITLDSETLDLLDHFLPNLTKEGIEFFVKTLIKQAGIQAVKRDALAKRDFAEYLAKHPQGSKKKL
jgi:hypothetical protein